MTFSEWFKTYSLISATALLIVVAIFSFSVLRDHRESGVMTVSFLDVGQGDAVFIEAPNGNQVLIDGGSGSRVLRELNSVMPFWDRSIDIVIATHPDQDHIGGLLPVLERYTVSGLVHTGSESETELDEMILKQANDKKVVVRTVRAGQTLRLSPRIHIDILFPSVDPDGMDPNDASIVMRLVYGETAFLFSGDAPKAVEGYVADLYGKTLESDVVKIGHHGSDTSSAVAWLGWSSPEYAIISAGADNRYGHPHQEVLDTIEKFDIETLETAKEGTIVFESDGKRVYHLQ